MSKAKYALEGCGIAILVLLPYIWPQVSPRHAAVYLSVLPATSITSGILIDFIVRVRLGAFLIALCSRPDEGAAAHRILGSTAPLAHALLETIGV